MKRALVLSGGSIKGSFQAGAISEVLNSGWTPDAIYGTSVGSLNGGFLAERAGRAVVNGDDPDWPQIGNELINFWQDNITGFDKIGKKLSEKEIIIDALFEKYDGLIDTKPLQRLVKKELKFEYLNKTPIEFFACAVNIIDGKTIYANPKNEMKILDYIIASTAIPIVMPITYIGNGGRKAFVDGGIKEVAPLRKAVKDGYEEIICIACDEIELSGVKFNEKNILYLVERLMQIVTNELLNNDLDILEGMSNIQIKVIRPEVSLGIEMEHFTSEHIKAAIEVGRLTAKNILGA